MKKCQTRNKRSLGSTLSRSYSPPSSAVVPVAKRGARPFGRCARFRLREMSVKVLIESDASSDGCDARKRPNVHRGAEPKDPGALYHHGGRMARRVRRLRRPETPNVHRGIEPKNPEGCIIIMGNLRKPHVSEEALSGRLDHRRQFSKVGSSPPSSALPGFNDT